jgi:2-enoate reductase
MEAAITAAQRGHHVKLFDQGTRLGGQLILAEIPPAKDIVGDFTRHLISEIKRLGIEVELGKEATLDMIEAAKPDAIIVATGVKNIVPDIPGINAAHVVMAEDVLLGREKVGMEIVIIGGEVSGCETAEFLVDRDRIVTIVEIMDRLASKISPILGAALQDRLIRKGVTLYTGVKREEFRESSLVITTKDGEEKVIEVNTIVLACGGNPNTELYEQLKGRFAKVYLVGDSAEPRNIMEATTEGLNTALTI